MINMLTIKVETGTICKLGYRMQQNSQKQLYVVLVCVHVHAPLDAYNYADRFVYA